jgi:hypothetical protein
VRQPIVTGLAEHGGSRTLLRVLSVLCSGERRDGVTATTAGPTSAVSQGTEERSLAVRHRDEVAQFVRKHAFANDFSGIGGGQGVREV